MNRSAELTALVPPGVITVTSTVPLPAGEVTVIWVSEFTVGVIEVLPKWTAVAPVKLVPLIVTVVPPDAGPEPGEIPVTIGAAAHVYPLLRVPLPPEVLTTTSTMPAEPVGVVAVRVVSLETLTPAAGLPPTVTELTAELEPPP